MVSCKQTKFWEGFNPGIKDAPAKLWLLLGEASAKCQYISGVPLQPGIAEELLSIYLAKGVFATTALEGNALTEEQIREHLKEPQRLPPSQEYLGKEVDNIVSACNEIVNEIRSTNVSHALAPETIKLYNKRVLDGLPLEDKVIPGAIRKHRVYVGDHLPPEPGKCEDLLDKLCHRYEVMDSDFPQGLESVQSAILKAVLTHLFLVWIHPFGDGNGRTARLLELKTLLSAGIPIPASHLLSNHYNLTRSEYARQLGIANKTGKTIDFALYAVQGFVDQLNEQILSIRRQQLRVAWNDYVHETFSQRNSSAEIRQRHLVLDLSRQTQPVSLKKMTEISPRIAKAYADKTTKTLSRDLNALRDMGLIRLRSNGYVANKEIIFAFLPVTGTNCMPDLHLNY